MISTKNILLYFLLLLSLGLNAQFQGGNRPGGRPGGVGGFGGNNRNQGNANDQTDPNRPQTPTTKKKGKLLDDSTKQIYSPKTVKYFLEKDIFNNRKILYSIDTSMNAFHHFNYLQRNGNKIQDLGNIATASRPVFYEPTLQIGQLTGYSVYDVYSQQSSNVKYYDTKSPYTNMYYASGGLGQTVLNFDFVRNINKLWNAGFSLQNINGAKQYGSNNSNLNNLSSNWNAILHSNYASKDSAYKLLANFNYINHECNDEGGVNITASGRGISASEDPFMKTAITTEKKKQLHIYHEYAMAKGFQLYHIFDFTKQSNIFIDSDLNSGFKNKIYRTITAVDSLSNTKGKDSLSRNYRLIENKIGIKGYYSGFNYRIHFRRKDFKMIDSLDRRFVEKTRIIRNENFLGGWANYYFKDSTKAFAEAEYRIGKDLNFRFEYDRKHLKLGYYQASTSPTLLQERFYSSVASWNNKFKNQFSSTFYGNLSYSLANFTVTPSFNYSILSNIIYFDTTGVPSQTSSIITILQTGGNLAWHKGKFRVDGDIFFTAKTGPDFIRIPALFTNTRISYDFKYAKKLLLQVGLDLHYKSAYYAYSYMPAIQQFYLQDKINVKQGIMADVFLNTKLNRVRLFVKYSQLNQLLLGEYFVAPNFKGLRGAVSFGVNWPLFD